MYTVPVLILSVWFWHSKLVIMNEMIINVYESPQVQEVELHLEGILCDSVLDGSSDGNIDDYLPGGNINI